MARSLYSELGPPLGRPLVSPRPERLLIDPEGERAPPDQGVVVLLPVADAVGGLRGGLASGHRGCGAWGRRGVQVWPIAPVYRSSLGRRSPSCNNALHNYSGPLYYDLLSISDVAIRDTVKGITILS